MKFGDKRYYVFILLGVFALALYVQLGMPKDAGSIYSANPYGTKAFFLFLRQQGITVKPWLTPLSALSEEHEEDGILFIVSPQKEVQPAQLTPWLKAGNDVVLLGSLPKDLRVLFKDTDKEEEAASEEPIQAEDEEDSTVSEWLRALYHESLDAEASVYVDCEDILPEICNGVRQLTRRPGSLASYIDDARVIVADESGPLLMRKKVEKGDVWIFPEETLIRNEYIDKFDNLRLLFQLATTASVVYFDEFHHGYVAPASKLVQSNKNNVYLLAGFILGYLILLALTRSFRFGPPTPTTTEGAPSTVEFTSALGLLYSEHSATSVLRHYFLQWKKRMGAQYSVSPRLSNEAFIDKLIEQNTEGISNKETLRDAARQFSDDTKSSEYSLTESIGVLERQHKS